MREQLLAEIHLREKTEEHQHRLEQDLDYWRDRMGEASDEGARPRRAGPRRR
jgi:hypothetical protein